MNHQTKARFRVTGQLIAGLVLAGLGMLFTLDNLEIVRAREILRYWPVVLLLVGISQILQARSSAGMVGGSIWILIGGVLLGERLDLISNAFRFWPLLLIGVGAYVIFQSFNRREVPPGDRSDRVSAVAVLGGVDRRVISTTFLGGDVTAFMGGGKLDLRDATHAAGRRSDRRRDGHDGRLRNQGPGNLERQSSRSSRSWEDTRTRPGIPPIHRLRACASGAS